jgi:hypothetical protein
MLVIWQALTFQQGMILRAHLVFEGLHQARFADTDFATDEHHMAASISGLGPAVQQKHSLSPSAY